MNGLTPQSVRISFRFSNTDTADGHLLRTVGDPFAFFSRLSVLVGSVVCEDIVDYSRTHNMFQTLTSSTKRVNDNIEGFGHRFSNLDANKQYSNDGTDPGCSKRVTCKLLSGLFSQYKYLPLQFSVLSW